MGPPRSPPATFSQLRRDRGGRHRRPLLWRGEGVGQHRGKTNGTSFYAKAISFIGAADNSGAFDGISNMRASKHMLQPSNGNGEAILIKMAPSAPRLIVPTWHRGETPRDTGRLQLQGAVTLTGALYADVIVAATDMHDFIEVDTE